MMCGALPRRVLAAQAVPPPAGGQHPRRGGQAAPAQLGHPVTVTAGGQRIVLRTWRLGQVEAVVAVSAWPFPMPAGARGVSSAEMAWSARLGRLGLYCINGRTSELVAALVRGQNSPHWRRGCRWHNGGRSARWCRCR